MTDDTHSDWGIPDSPSLNFIADLLGPGTLSGWHGPEDGLSLRTGGRST